MEQTGSSTVDVVDLPVSGERMVFRSPLEDASHLAFDFHADPDGGVSVAHRHLHQSETLRCLRGTVRVTVDGVVQDLGPGDEITIPPGAVHTLVNPGPEAAHCSGEYRPAGRSREWFALLAGHQQTTGREPGPLDLGPFLLGAEVFRAGPVLPQRLLYRFVLGPLGTLLGRRSRMLRNASEVAGRPVRW